MASNGTLVKNKYEDKVGIVIKSEIVCMETDQFEVLYWVLSDDAIEEWWESEICNLMNYPVD